MLKDKGKSGIYCWTSPSGKQYVGLAKNLEVRKRAFLKFYKDYTGGASKIDIARKKYNSEVDHNLIENMENSLEFYKKLSDDNRTRLEEMAERNKTLEAEI